MDSDPEDIVPLVEKETLSDGLEGGGARRWDWDFVILTVPFFGLQLAWTVQQVFGVPYLLSLGVPNTQVPIFVLSGPLAGLVGPPVVAALSDTCHGKRKPFIFFGGGGTILSFLLLAAAQPLAVTLTYRVPSAATTATHVIAGLAIYALNFSIQPLQVGLRASVIDHFGPRQQPRANLCISRFSALGSVFVAAVGLGYSPAFWDLSVVVATVLALLLGVVAVTNPASPPDRSQLSEPEEEARSVISPRAHVSRLLDKARHLPPVTRRVCRVQLVSWFAWFLVLNYTSALVSRIYDPPNNAAKPSSTQRPSSADAVSRVALLFHTASLATLVIVSMAWRQRAGADSRNSDDHEKNAADDETAFQHGGGLARTRDVLVRRVWKPALGALAASLAATCLLASGAATPFPSAVTTLSFLLGANGVLFALSNWVPYALIAYEAAAQARVRGMLRLAAGGEGEDGETVGDGDDDGADETPVLLAVHNVAITVPQIAASAASWLLMQGLALLGLRPDVVWVFVMCIPAALWAAFI